MIPKILDDNEFNEGFIKILRTPEYIYDLSVGQAKEYLDFANSFFERSWINFKAEIQNRIKGINIIIPNVEDEYIKNHNLFDFSNSDFRKRLNTVKKLLEAKVIMQKGGLQTDNSLSLQPPLGELKKKYPDKYYAWYHMIKIHLGKEQNFPNNFSKKEIIQFGKNRYKTGEGFYKAFNQYDLIKISTFLHKMTKKDRPVWKRAIIDISDNDPAIISYLKNLPKIGEINL